MVAIPNVGGAIPTKGASLFIWSHKGAAKSVSGMATEPATRAMRGKRRKRISSR